MRNWVKFGCFLTGYKYERLIHSSIASEKTVKKYTSAILLICMLWGFIGYGFTNLYIVNTDENISNIIFSFFGSAVLIIAVIQIERQIILSDKANKLARGIRIIIGFIMAIIGSIIIDQMLFHKDIQTADEPSVIIDADLKAKSDINIINKRIEELENLNGHWRNQITSLDGQVYQINNTSTSSQSVGKIDGKDKILSSVTKSQIKTPVQNPNTSRIAEYNSNIQGNVKLIDSLEKQKSQVNASALEYTRKNRGLLKHFDALYIVLFRSNSSGAFIVWFLFLMFFFFIELLVLAIKFFDKKNDYEEAVQHQMEIYIDQLKALKGEPKIT